MWISIVGVVLLAAWMIYIIIHEIIAKKRGRGSFNECDCCSKSKMLIANYKALKKKELKNK